ncbi:MAG: hypothetical protein QXF12_00475 [Candidatus Aenigmatarchaeota archaeon]
MTNGVKYITHEIALDFYDKEVVENVIGYFESFVRPKIKNIMSYEKESYPELCAVLEKTYQTRRAETIINYSPYYDRFMNYIRYILEQIGEFENIKEYMKNYNIDEDLIIAILASHIRKRMR